MLEEMAYRVEPDQNFMVLMYTDCHKVQRPEADHNQLTEMCTTHVDCFLIRMEL